MEHETKEGMVKGASLPCSNGGLSRELRVRAKGGARRVTDCYHTASSGCNSAFRRLTFLFILPFGHVRRRYVPFAKGTNNFFDGISITVSCQSFFTSRPRNYGVVKSFWSLSTFTKVSTNPIVNQSFWVHSSCLFCDDESG